ncbi:unnamed protein product [Sphagnum jensenii]|uniref:Uncharacterized protein n=1 Tax=Sphagnum jensenii TaxID=128206 RepID=A0ABP0WB09_9BRYO
MSSWISPVPSARVAELTGGSAPPAGLDFDRQESLPGVSSCGVLHERQADLQHVVVGRVAIDLEWTNPLESALADYICFAAASKLCSAHINSAHN